MSKEITFQTDEAELVKFGTERVFDGLVEGDPQFLAKVIQVQRNPDGTHLITWVKLKDL